MISMVLTQNILKELLHYDPLTGVFTWLERDLKYFEKESDQRSWNLRFSGKRAGSTSSLGYRIILIFKYPRKAHRLAFLYMIGRLPIDQTDHINHMRSDNRWLNLREATPQENMQNLSLSKSNTSGHIGVTQCKRSNKWLAMIGFNKKKVPLGYFVDIEDAIEVRKQAEMDYGFHENHGYDIIARRVELQIGEGE